MAWKEDLMAALKNESLHDVELVGTDNVAFPCSKFMLASRSNIFEKMFFGDFQERTCERVSLNYPSVILNILVKYCYTDELDLDMLVVDNADYVTDEEATRMVQLRDAANYFELPEIFSNITNEIGETVATSSYNDIECVCAILMEMMNRGETEGPMWDIMMAVIDAKPQQCLLPQRPPEMNKGAMLCSPRLLRTILHVVKDQFVVAQCLQKWFDHHKEGAAAEEEYVQENEGSNTDQDNKQETEMGQSSDANQDPDLEAEDQREEEDKRVLREIGDKIDFTSISLSQLTQIKPCSLFPMERIYNAFVYHGSNPEQPRTPANTIDSTLVYVAGCGVKCMNGWYSPNGQGRYFKNGKYGEIDAVYRLLRLGAQWTLSILPKDANVPLVMYKVNEDKNDTSKIPFTWWECCDGTEPSPYVASVQSGNHSEAVLHSEAGSINPLTAETRKRRIIRAGRVSSLCLVAGCEKKIKLEFWCTLCQF